MEIKAENRADIAIPQRTIKRVREPWKLLLIEYVNPTAIKPKMKAEICIKKGLPDRRIARAAPNPAPEVTPKISGDTRGF